MAFMEPQVSGPEFWVGVDAGGMTWFPMSDTVGSLELGMGLEFPEDGTEVSEDWIICQLEPTYPNTARIRGERLWARLCAAVRDYHEPGEVDSVAVLWGWGTRLSAPGYMDCTDWDVHHSEEEAAAALAELEEENDDDTEEEDAPEESDEPTEGDYVTRDHIHWYEHGTGKLLLTTADPSDPNAGADDYPAQLLAHMRAEAFFPAVWLVSDHGNWHQIIIDENPDGTVTVRS